MGVWSSVNFISNQEIHCFLAGDAGPKGDIGDYVLVNLAPDFLCKFLKSIHNTKWVYKEFTSYINITLMIDLH